MQSSAHGGMKEDWESAWTRGWFHMTSRVTLLRALGRGDVSHINPGSQKPKFTSWAFWELDTEFPPSEPARTQTNKQQNVAQNLHLPFSWPDLLIFKHHFRLTQSSWSQRGSEHHFRLTPSSWSQRGSEYYNFNLWDQYHFFSSKNKWFTFSLKYVNLLLVPMFKNCNLNAK